MSNQPINRRQMLASLLVGGVAGGLTAGYLKLIEEHRVREIIREELAKSEVGTTTTSTVNPRRDVFGVVTFTTLQAQPGYSQGYVDLGMLPVRSLTPEILPVGGFPTGIGRVAGRMFFLKKTASANTVPYFIDGNGNFQAFSFTAA